MLTRNRGFFGRGDMQKEFEEASFALEKGQVSKVVETASGLHLIQRYAWRLFRQQSQHTLTCREQTGVDLHRTRAAVYDHMSTWIVR